MWLEDDEKLFKLLRNDSVTFDLQRNRERLSFSHLPVGHRKACHNNYVCLTIYCPRNNSEKMILLSF